MRDTMMEAAWRYLRDLIDTPLDAPAPDGWTIFLDIGLDVEFARMGFTAEEE